MPTFLTQTQVYDIINRELPEGLFAYSPSPNKFYITSELDSYAKTIADTYSTMQNIYKNMFITTADDKLVDFELMYFNRRSAGDLTNDERRARILAKIRSQAFVSIWDILTFVCSYVPIGTYVQILESGNPYGVGSWLVGYSEIGMNTILGDASPQSLIGENADLVWTRGWVYGDPLPSGVSADPLITQAAVTSMRNTAYSYEIRIFDYEITGDLLTNFELDLQQIEPARSQHYLYQNLNLSDYYLTIDVNNVDQFTKVLYQGNNIHVDCIALDDTQLTGYKGRTYST